MPIVRASTRGLTTSLLIAREGGPPPSELTAPERAAWAAHFQRYPPVVVAVGRLHTQLATVAGVKLDLATAAAPWSVLPGLDGSIDVPHIQGDGVSTGDPLTDKILARQQRVARLTDG